MRRGRRRNYRNYSMKKKEKRLTMDLIREIISWVFQIAVVLTFAFVIVYYAGEQIRNIGDK